MYFVFIPYVTVIRLHEMRNQVLCSAFSAFRQRKTSSKVTAMAAME